MPGVWALDEIDGTVQFNVWYAGLASDICVLCFGRCAPWVLHVKKSPTTLLTQSLVRVDTYSFCGWVMFTRRETTRLMPRQV